MADLATLTAQLTELQAKLTAAIVPGVRSVQDSDGSRVEYSLGNPAVIQAEIRRVEAQIAILQSCTRPFSYLF